MQLEGPSHPRNVEAQAGMPLLWQEAVIKQGKKERFLKRYQIIYEVDIRSYTMEVL
jgi:hypothetical protein